jgi:succinate dehydrogenase hydrophobic anchor subunit
MTTKKTSLIFIAASCVFCTGCGQAPSVEVLGSFFPAWMFCLVSGVILAFLVRYLLARCRIESQVGPLAIFYPSVVLLFSALLWLIFFR